MTYTQDLRAHDLHMALAGIAANEVRTAQEDADAFPRLATFGEGAVYVGRFAGQSPWERHREADELLHVLEGEVEVTLLTESSTVITTVRAGSILVVPKGIWHRQLAKPSVTLLAVTPDDTEISTAADPRRT